MRRFLIIPALVATLSLTACGEDEGKIFADGVNKAQNEAATSINSSVASGSPDEIRRTAAKAFSEAASDIRKLKAPEGAGDERDTLVNTLDKASQTLNSNGKLNVAYLSAVAAQTGEQIKDLNRAF